MYASEATMLQRQSTGSPAHSSDAPVQLEAQAVKSPSSPSRGAEVGALRAEPGRSGSGNDAAAAAAAADAAHTRSDRTPPTTSAGASGPAGTGEAMATSTKPDSAVEEPSAAVDAATMPPEECLISIAKAVGVAAGSSASQVLTAVQIVVGELEQLREQVQQHKRDNLALHIQVANNAADMLDMRHLLFEQECAAEPSIVQLKTLLCDPSIAREFTTLKDEAVRLQKELQVAKDQIQTVNFNTEAKRGRLLMSKLKSLQRENEVLGQKLKSVAFLESQVLMVGELAENMRNAYSCLESHVAALDAEAEDMSGHIASMQKVHSSAAVPANGSAGVPHDLAPINGPLAPASPYICEPTYGLPVVRHRLQYSELLRDVRQGHVKEIMWFKDSEALSVEGPCLVVYQDGTLKQANVPPVDVRMRMAMESHGVHSGMVPPEPTDAQVEIPLDLGQFGKTALDYLPYVLIVGIWGLVQTKNLFRGDASDRAQIKRKEAEDRAEMNRRRREDEKIINIAKMVAAKYSDEAIRADIRNMKMDLTDDEVTALILEARKSERLRTQGKWSLEEEEDRRMQQRAAEASKAAADRAAADGEDQSGAAAGLGRMSSMKIRKAKLRSVNRTRMRGKLKNLDDEDIFFDDVAGIDEAKRELQEIVDFFNLPERFAKSGARSPRGVLLYGPPGTGKTLLARAVAGEADATFVGVNASEFVEMFVGVGAARVRDLFQTARENAPAVIFIDEIDAVGRVRGGSQGNDERDQTLNQMLSEMDGFDERTGIVVIAATNRRDVLDPALVRPGRFDRQVNVALPNLDGRVEIFTVHLNRRKWDREDVQLTELAFETQQFSGAMIANLVNVAALICARDKRDIIMHRDLEAALDQDRVGQRRAPYSDAITRRIAVVEGATAAVATLMPAIETVVRVSTLPTQKAMLGQTVLKVNEQRELSQLFTKRYLQEQLLMVLAGRAAEIMVLGEPSTLNARNLGFARRIANKLVVSNAMSDNAGIGPRTLSLPSVEMRNIAQIVPGRISGVAHATADAEMEALLAKADADVLALLQRNRAFLDAVVDGLTKAPYELNGEQIEALAQAHANADDLRRREEGLAVEAYI